jgi:hypothetical protein
MADLTQYYTGFRELPDRILTLGTNPEQTFPEKGAQRMQPP